MDCREQGDRYADLVFVVMARSYLPYHVLTETQNIILVYLKGIIYLADFFSLVSAADYDVESSLVSVHNFSNLHQVRAVEEEAALMYQSLAMHA